MKTYNYKTADIAKRLTAAEGTLSNRVKTFNLYLSPRSKSFLGEELAHDFKGWAKERGVEYTKVDIDDVLKGWNKYAEGASYSDYQDGRAERAVTVCKVPRYKLNEDGTDFVYEETTDKRGHKQYNKVVEFYTFEPKAVWTLAEVATCVGRTYGDGCKEVTFKLNTPYELVGSDLVVSTNEVMIERAKMSAADEAALLRMDAE